jgi:hypothetical protein
MSWGFEHKYSAERQGIIIERIDHRGPAFEAGLESGDLIIAVDDLDASSGDVLSILEKSAGDRLELLVQPKPKATHSGPFAAPLMGGIAVSQQPRRVTLILRDLPQQSLIERITSFLGHTQTPEKPCGVGLGIAVVSPRTLVTELVPGGPAEKCKQIFPGDELIAIDGTEIVGFDIAQVRALMLGPPKSEVRLTVRRPSSDDNPGARIDVAIVRSLPPAQAASTRTPTSSSTGIRGGNSSGDVGGGSSRHLEFRFGDGFAFARFSHGDRPAAAATPAMPPHWRFAGHTLREDEEDVLAQAAYHESLAHMHSVARTAGDDAALRSALLAAHLDPWPGPRAAAPHDADDLDGTAGDGAAERAAALSRLPVTRLGATEGGSAGACAVCLEPMGGGEMVARLPCLHLFHHDCIGPWILRAGRCPVCKHRV